MYRPSESPGLPALSICHGARRFRGSQTPQHSPIRSNQMTISHQDRTGALIMRKLRSAAPEGMTRYELRESLPPPLKPSFPAAFDDLVAAHLVRQKPKTPGRFQLAIVIDKERAKKGILRKLERATRPVPKQELKDGI